MSPPFVPSGFSVPTHLAGPGFQLEPLGPEHNERDHEAWMSSIDHIQATPGFADWDWPEPMSLQDNLGDLEGHATDFEQRRGFTYSVLDGDEVIGCVYIYPSRDPDYDASVRSWVRASHAEMDEVLWRTVSDWLADGWPFSAVLYAPR
ncbi:MAG: N-acetyltransferase [Acidimicrobiia bacterium]|nr:N-acetyltransferase [Acidimicrobiia bacterium]